MKSIKQSLQALREEDHRRALYAALVFIMLLILFFLLVSLEVPDPPKKEEIIEITMEDIEFDLGSQPEGGSQSSSEISEVTPVPQSDPAPSHDTQTDASVTVPSGPGGTGTESNNELVDKPDDAFAFPGSGQGSGTGSGPGFGQGSGVGGNGQGNTPGDGDYNPSRKVTQAPTFNASAQEEGKIALDIYVDAAGNIVNVKFKESKSTSGSDYLRKLAEKAAKTMRYDAKPGAGVEYVGYQIFTFKKS
jgi:outer membrane biosynthesis protein TonB